MAEPSTEELLLHVESKDEKERRVQVIVDYVNVTECPYGHKDLVIAGTGAEYHDLTKVTFSVRYLCTSCNKLFSVSKKLITERHIVVKRTTLIAVNKILNGRIK